MGRGPLAWASPGDVEALVAASFANTDPATRVRSRPASAFHAPAAGELFRAACWLYAAAVLGLWLLVATAGVWTWPATLYVYGPRWIAALPLGVLVPLALFSRRWRLFAPLGMAAVVLVVPLAGYCFPWRTALVGPLRGPALRVMTCNINGARCDVGALGRLIVREKPDIVLLQESKPDTAGAVFWQGKWHVGHVPGTTLASRYPFAAMIPIDREFIRRGAVVNFLVQLPIGKTVNVFGVHLSTPRYAMEEAAHFSRQTPGALCESLSSLWFESDTSRRWMRAFSGPALVVGDFNQPIELVVFRRFWSDQSDSFSEAGLGFGATKLTRWFGTRIDHILHGPEWRARRSWVGPDVGSDHRPLFAELEWVVD
jgi:endonuclease/exonuclease/phosphatase (EEP) superfamily protein YafD